MIYPRLIDEKFCNTLIKVIIYSEDIDRYGNPHEYNLGEMKCNYQSSSKTVYSDEKKMIQLSAKVYFNGDIIPQLPEISGGEVEIQGIKRKINKGYKCRNLDGSVNYTLLEIL